jgi:hypothetical protein
MDHHLLDHPANMVEIMVLAALAGQMLMAALARMAL